VIKILLLSGDPTTLALVRAASDAFECKLDAFADANDLKRKLEKPVDDMPVKVIFDLAALATAGVRTANACTRVRQYFPTAKIGLIASATHYIDEAATEWATESGADVIVAQINPWRWNATGERLLTALLDDADAVAASSRRVGPYLRAAAQTATGNVQARLIAAAENDGIDLPALAFRMQRSGGVNIADRRYRLRIYPECFVASEGVVWLERALRIPHDNAIAVGQALQSAGLIYHVAREQPFTDADLYFRVAQIPSSWSIERFYSLIRSAGGFNVADRSYLGAAYPKCFVGSEAVDWMQAQGHTVNEALSMGQRLLDLSLAHHVLDQHPFKNEKLYYRFYRDE
jgi:Domain found in Dishevelled, Egl-10, and Pleckstrin (DEP)